MTFGESCNCGNCPKQYTKECPADKVRKFHTPNAYTQIEQFSNYVGCLSHPRAREVLMADVVEELERNAEHEDALKKESKSNESWMLHAGANSGYLNAISLIRGDPK